MRFIFLAVALSSTVSFAGELYLPDASRTPGAINAEIHKENLQVTVCVTGYTKQIRPPQRYTNDLRKKQFLEWSLPGKVTDYHEDHLVPLCAGGHPDDPANLWPQPLEGKWRDADKNQLEQSVCRALCKGAITLQEAQALFLAPADWTKSYESFFGFASDDRKNSGGADE